MSRSTLIIFTKSFPYGNGEHFVGEELAYLAKRFDRLILVPEQVFGNPRSLPDSVHLELEYSGFGKLHRLGYVYGFLSCVTSRLFFEELRSNPWLPLKPLLLKKMIGYLSRAISTRKWILEYIESKQLLGSRIIVYTYWLGYSSLGAGMLNSIDHHISTVSRAHGFDLYSERHCPPYIPLQLITLMNLSSVFTISEHGLQYIFDRFPSVGYRCQLARLGVKDPGFDTARSSDNIFRIVSCSFMVSVKRLSLIISSLATYGSRFPDQQVKWTHFGDGPLWDELVDQAQRDLPSNVDWRFAGYTQQSEIMSFYRLNTVDVFINVSESEGIPVAIMEAQSCGIPAIATAVGGTPEIVDNRNGVLLPENPTIDNVVNALHTMKNNMETKRINAKEKWRTTFHSNINYEFFAESLQQIMLSNVHRDSQCPRG